MRSTLRVVTAATAKRLTTVAAVQSELGLADNASFGRIGTLIDEASSLVAGYAGREFGRVRMAELFIRDGWDDRRAPVMLSVVPVAALISVNVGNDILDAATVEFSAETGLLHRYCGGKRTEVVYDAGYVLPGSADRSLPAAVERACIDTVVALWHRARRGDPMIRSESVEGVGSVSYLDPAGGAAAALPPTAVAALAGYVELRV